jgi:3-hydroxyisobutyrate dehydrogenase
VSEPLRVALLGTGNMGSGMARALLRAGHPVTVWNRTPDRAASLAGDGATVATEPAGAARGADVLVTMLADWPAVRAALSDGALEALAPDAVWLQMGSVGPDGADSCRVLAQDAGVAVIDAPVVGGPERADAGGLIVLASGDPPR